MFAAIALRVRLALACLIISAPIVPLADTATSPPTPAAPAAATPEPAAPAAAVADPPRAPRILLAADDEWEEARAVDVVAVLGSAGQALLRHVPEADIPTVVVTARGGPILLYDRSPEGHFQIRLDTGGTRWSQYGFQFGHEMCHLLCRTNPRLATHRWFEEALCETASLFVLRRMAETWDDDPPYPNWRRYAPKLREYAEDRLAESPRPPEMPLAVWYARYRDDLEERPTDRANGVAIAAALLPLFEAEPDHWEAIHWLNAAEPPQPASFREHLAAWRRRVPPARRSAVEAIAREFGVPLW